MDHALKAGGWALRAGGPVLALATLGRAEIPGAVIGESLGNKT